MNDEMTPEERIQEIRRLGTEYALLSRDALTCVRRIQELHDHDPKMNANEIRELLWRLRQIKAQRNTLDAQFAKLGARAQLIIQNEPVKVPDELPAWLDYDDMNIEPGKTSHRKK